MTVIQTLYQIIYQILIPIMCFLLVIYSILLRKNPTNHLLRNHYLSFPFFETSFKGFLYVTIISYLAFARLINYYQQLAIDIPVLISMKPPEMIKNAFSTIIIIITTIAYLLQFLQAEDSLYLLYYMLLPFHQYEMIMLKIIKKITPYVLAISI
jgi:hypothetical protein